MDEKIQSLIMEAIKTAQVSVTFQPALQESQQKENKLWRNFVMKLFCLSIATLLIVVILFVTCDMYKTYKQYDYSGYPATIENNNIGGDYNGGEEGTKTTEAPKTPQAP